MTDVNEQFSDAEETDLEVGRKALADLLVQANVAELPLLGSGKTDYVALRTLMGRARPRLVETNSATAGAAAPRSARRRRRG